MKLPDGPRTPSLLQTIQLIARPTEFLDSCRERYGTPFTVRVLGLNSPPVVFFSHPNAIQDIFSLPSSQLDFRKATHVFEPLKGEPSIILQEGRSHQRQRQLMMPLFPDDRMRSYGQLICAIVEQAMAAWTIGLSFTIQKAQLPYLSAVCAETLRVNPLALICTPRQTLEPLPLAGYDFDAGTILIPCIYLAHRRSVAFSDPQPFKPERFFLSKFSPYEYLPFGGGSRGCIGMAFSMFEMKLVVSTILSRFQLALKERRPVRPVRRGITIVASGGVPVVVTGDRNSKENVSLF